MLRKFATLELENGEFRKKLMLRDERIKQLENTSRGMTGDMRQQAERQVAELMNMREQIQVGSLTFSFIGVEVLSSVFTCVVCVAAVDAG